MKEFEGVTEIEFKGIDMFQWLKGLPENTKLKVIRPGGVTCLFEPISNAIYVVSESGFQPEGK